jgi:hypothetical protein
MTVRNQRHLCPNDAYVFGKTAHICGVTVRVAWARPRWFTVADMTGAGPDVARIREWFDDYLRAFTACGRGDSDDMRVLLEYYGVPLLFTTDDDVAALASEAEVLNAVQAQILGLRTAEYDHSEPLGAETTVLNRTTAIHSAAFARVRADGSEFGRLRATYLITGWGEARRFSAIAVQTV